jgi:DNA polymerase III subunit chi
MTEILFYQLKGQTLEQVLPGLLQRSLDRGWRVVVQASSQERVEALDAHLWTWRDDAFLPHGTWRDSEAAEHPVLLTLNEDNPNGAIVRFLIEGEDAEALDAARVRWREAKSAGFEVTYWQTDERGGWRRQE